jgi:hypothetical protein
MPMNLSNTGWLICVHCTNRQILVTLAVKTLVRAPFIESDALANGRPAFKLLRWVNCLR